MRNQKANFDTPPVEWVNELQRYDSELSRVELLWRRGGGVYRVMLEHEAQYAFGDDPIARGAIEFEGASLRWAAKPDASPVQRRVQIFGLVEDLWMVAGVWAESRVEGEWCDFKIVGHDSNNRQIFEHRRRLFLKDQGEDPTRPPDEAVEPDEEVEGDPSPKPEQAANEAPASRGQNHDHVRTREQQRELDWERERERERGWARERERERTQERERSDAKVDAHLDRLAHANEVLLGHVQEAVTMATRSIGSAPELVRGASDLMRETIREQREMFERYRELQDGRARVQEQVVREEHKTRRRERMLGFIVEVTKVGAATVGPLISEGARIYMNPEARLVTDFERAQQAIAYIVHSLTTPMLNKIFRTNPNMAGTFLGVLNMAAITENEREALETLDPALGVFRSQEFDEAINTTQIRYAVNYIMGRIAFYCIPYYAEGA